MKNCKQHREKHYYEYINMVHNRIPQHTYTKPRSANKCLLGSILQHISLRLLLLVLATQNKHWARLCSQKPKHNKYAWLKCVSRSCLSHHYLRDLQRWTIYMFYNIKQRRFITYYIFIVSTGWEIGTHVNMQTTTLLAFIAYRWMIRWPPYTMNQHQFVAHNLLNINYRVKNQFAGNAWWNCVKRPRNE